MLCAVLAKNCLRRKALDQGQAAVRPAKPTPVLQALLKGDRHKLFAIFCCFVFFFTGCVDWTMSSVHLTLRKWKLQPKLNDASHAAGTQRQQLAGLGSFLTVTPCCPSPCQSKNKNLKPAKMKKSRQQLAAALMLSREVGKVLSKAGG